MTCPLKFNSRLLPVGVAMSGLAPGPGAPSAQSVPREIVIGPVQVLLPESVHLPVPVFVISVFALPVRSWGSAMDPANSPVPAVSPVKATTLFAP